MAERYPKPSAEDIAIANAIIARTIMGDKNRIHYAQGDYPSACHLSKKYTGYTPSSNCNTCRLVLFDKLRSIAGLSVARKPMGDDSIAARKAICHACLAYHPSTDSCGRLILDALSSHPVTIDGVDVHPCGCIVSLKAMFRSETCPGNFWPHK